MRMLRGPKGWPVCTVAAGLVSVSVWAQNPVPPTGPTVSHVAPMTRREIRRQAWRDTFIGRPADFVEPPIGAYVRENFSLMRSKADAHRFTLYRTDFLAGTDRFSPTGATRFNLMASRLPNWLGPIIVEGSPDDPVLGEARRASVLAILQKAGAPVGPERVVLAPSNYPGGLGEDSANYHNVMIMRDRTAPANHSLTPRSDQNVGGGGGSGGGGGGSR